jgi:hypothetical protein
MFVKSTDLKLYLLSFSYLRTLAKYRRLNQKLSEMTENFILKRLIHAQQALKATINKILDLNRKLKKAKDKEEISSELKQELKLLNKVADQQAKIVKLYEYDLRKKVSN